MDIKQFNYDSLDTAAADTLRDAAAKILNVRRLAIQDVGRWLLQAKMVVSHGAFAAWASTELGMERRTTQRAMLAAQFLEGKCVSLTHLPAEVLYQLSAPSAPVDVVNAVIAASTTDAPMPVKEIIRLLKEAKKPTKQAKPPERTRGRKAEEAAARKRRNRIAPVFEKFAKELTDENLVDLVAALSDPTTLIAIIKAEQTSRVPAPEDTDPATTKAEPTSVVPSKPDPTNWKNKVDYCLTATGGAEAALNARSSPSSASSTPAARAALRASTALIAVHSNPRQFFQPTERKAAKAVKAVI